MIFAIGLFCNWDGVHPVEFTGIISNFVALLSDKTFKAAFCQYAGLRHRHGAADAACSPVRPRC